MFVLDNASADSTVSTIQATLGVAGRVTVVSKPEPHSQTNHYNSMIDQIRKFEWCLIVDADEFVYARHHRGLKEYLATVAPNVTQVRLPWKMFGSSGFVNQPESVRRSFVWRAASLSDLINAKGIVRTKAIKQLCIHEHQMAFGRTVVEYDAVHLNHYPLMSREYFEKVKMGRGDVNEPLFDNVRNWTYFQAFDKREVHDAELADLVV